MMLPVMLGDKLKPVTCVMENAASRDTAMHCTCRRRNLADAALRDEGRGGRGRGGEEEERGGGARGRGGASAVETPGRQDTPDPIGGCRGDSELCQDRRGARGTQLDTLFAKRTRGSNSLRSSSAATRGRRATLTRSMPPGAERAACVPAGVMQRSRRSGSRGLPSSP